jgi:hypothetical protein
MNYRLATILDRENHTADTTKVIDLNLADVVSQFQIIYEPLNGSGGSGTAHPAKCISKIELVDGSDVLFSLSGMEAQAVDWYSQKKEPPNIMNYLDANISEMIYNMNFGRYLYDPTYAFDPTKFTNPQLKITIDIDAGGTGAASGNLTVLANIFDEKGVTPEGFLMSKEIKDYALAASTHEYTDLPIDFPYRKLFARILKGGVGLEHVFGNIKLSEDNDRRVPVNHTISEILKTMVGQTRPYREWIVTSTATTSSTFFCTPAYWAVFASSERGDDVVANTVGITGGDGGTFDIIATTGTNNASVLCEGWCPHGVIEIPFGIQDDPADWYDVTKLGSLRLDILSGAEAATTDSCQVFLQQARKYA